MDVATAGVAGEVCDPMAYELRCADATGDCPAAFTTATEDELLEHVKLHAAREHPDMTLDDEAVATVKGAVRTV